MAMQNRNIIAAAATLLLLGCTSNGVAEPEECAQARSQCMAYCNETFEKNPNSWEYGSCTRQCEKDPQICQRSSETR